MPGTDYPKALKDAIKTTFFNAYNNEPDGIYPELVTVVESGRGRFSETYGFLGSLPAVREWIDERITDAMYDYEYTIRNRKWQATLEIKREDVDADQYGQIKLRVQQLAWAARRHKERQVISALLTGTTGIGFDGKAFFAPDHPGGQSNLGNANFSADALKAAWIAMTNFKDDRGEPLGIVPDTILVGPQLQFDVSTLLQSEVVVKDLASGYATNYMNIWRGALRMLVSPYITGTQWYLLSLSAPLRPLILQQSDPLEFTSLTDPSEGSDVFWRDRYLFGIRERFNIGYGPWFFAYCGKAT